MTELSGQKNDAGKSPLDLVPPALVEEVGKVLGYGAQKYAPNQWRKGIASSRLMAATLRHLMAYQKGEDTDPESKLPHLAHAATNLGFLLEQQTTHPEADDRYNLSPVEENLGVLQPMWDAWEEADIQVRAKGLRHFARAIEIQFEEINDHLVRGELDKAKNEVADIISIALNLFRNMGERPSGIAKILRLRAVNRYRGQASAILKKYYDLYGI